MGLNLKKIYIYLIYLFCDRNMKQTTEKKKKKKLSKDLNEIPHFDSTGKKKIYLFFLKC